MSTTASASTSSRLLVSNMSSRETPAYCARPAKFVARKPYSVSAPPTASASSSRMKRPRAGSEAKAWTEVMTPERTMKAPSKASENAAMARNTVQLLNTPRFSVAASECTSAVPASHGMNEAFSTGSQNHQPPQPSS